LHILLPFLVGGFLKRVGAVRQEVGGNLSEEDTAESLAHGPVGFDGHGLVVVVADQHGAVRRNKPGILGLGIPLPSPAFLVLELMEVVIATSWSSVLSVRIASLPYVIDDASPESIINETFTPTRNKLTLLSS
jgi:hypothetical protein